MRNNNRLRVLYVEDNCDSFEMLRVMLGMAQIDLECAVTISEALSRAGSEKFDLYLLDTDLPDGSGLSLCRTLRAVDPAIPVLFYSGYSLPGEIKLGLEAGAQGYIAKPHSEKLAVTIIQLVENQRSKPFVVTTLPVLSAAAAA